MILVPVSRDEGRYVGVEDPETGKVTLIPLKQVRLRPAISITQEFEEEIPEPKRSRQEQVCINIFVQYRNKDNWMYMSFQVTILVLSMCS